MILPIKTTVFNFQISKKKFRNLNYFAQDLEATKITNLTKMFKISINKFLENIKILIASECEKVNLVAR
jgi:hypothetical protein